MSEKKRKTRVQSKLKEQNTTESYSQKNIPMWGMLVAAVMALFMVNIGLVILQKLGVTNEYIRIAVVVVLAIAAGLMSRPLTLALYNRFRSGKR